MSATNDMKDLSRLCTLLSPRPIRAVRNSRFLRGIETLAPGLREIARGFYRRIVDAASRQQDGGIRTETRRSTRARVAAATLFAGCPGRHGVNDTPALRFSRGLCPNVPAERHLMLVKTRHAEARQGRFFSSGFLPAPVRS